jgi:hypothetical protein
VLCCRPLPAYPAYSPHVYPYSKPPRDCDVRYPRTRRSCVSLAAADAVCGSDRLRDPWPQLWRHYVQVRWHLRKPGTDCIRGGGTRLAGVMVRDEKHQGR